MKQGHRLFQRRMGPAQFERRPTIGKRREILVGRRGEASLVPPYRLRRPNKAMALGSRPSGCQYIRDGMVWAKSVGQLCPSRVAAASQKTPSVWRPIAKPAVQPQTSAPTATEFGNVFTSNGSRPSRVQMRGMFVEMSASSAPICGALIALPLRHSSPL